MAGISGQRAKLEVMKKLSIESLLFNVKFFCFQVCGGRGWGVLSCVRVQAFFHFSKQLFSKVCCLQLFGKTAEVSRTVSSLKSGGVVRGDITSP